MAQIRIKHFVEKANRDGTWRRYWQPSASLRAAGWQPVKLSSVDRDHAIAEAQTRNREVEQWRLEKSTITSGGRTIAAPPARLARGTVDHLIADYKTSPEWKKLADASQETYGLYLTKIAEWCRDPASGASAPVAAINPARTKKKYDALMDYDQAGTPRGSVSSAQMFMSVVKIIFGWGMTHEPFDRLIPSERKGYPVLFQLTGTPPRVRVYSIREEQAFVQAADTHGLPHVADGLLGGVWAGQRPRDTLALAWPRAEGDRLKLVQSKTGKEISLPWARPLQERMAQIVERNGGATPMHLVTNPRTGQPFGVDHFRDHFNRVKTIAADTLPSIADITFQDARDTAVTRLASAGNDIPGICSITGHALDNAHSILRHYLDTTEEMADTAIAKVVAWYDNQVETLAAGENQ